MTTHGPRDQPGDFRRPFVCFTCRKSFKRSAREATRTCPDCGGGATQLHQKFRAPPRESSEKWRVVAFLVAHGFRYQSITDDTGRTLSYPTTMREAEEFVRRHGGRA